MERRTNAYTWRRRPTREVRVGGVGIGGDRPIRIQSMTTTPTTDVDATVAQAVRLVEAGCELVRVTVPTTRDARALPAIRAALALRGCGVPLIADVHFTPQVALQCVDHVDKVRINPGNYADRKRFEVREYTDAQYEAELERIEGVFGPLVDRCRERGVALRIGTNHGSLSDRILNRYGDTPLGMVESALEFVRICERRGFRDIVLSMKASSPVVVLQAYRMLADRMDACGMDYPLHLGVTEAGDGEDARIKSAIGIGALLDEGLGDTVRVSLTEDPVAEIPVARALVAPYDARGRREVGPVDLAPVPAEPRDPHGYRRRPSRPVRVGPATVGGDAPPAVEVPLGVGPTDAAAVQTAVDALVGARVAEEARPEIVSFVARDGADIDAVAALRAALADVAPRLALSVGGAAVAAQPEAAARAAHRLEIRVGGNDGALEAAIAACAAAGCALRIEGGDAHGDADRATRRAVEAVRRARDGGVTDVLAAVDPGTAPSAYAATRLLAARLDEAGLDAPIVLLDPGEGDGIDRLLRTSIALGGPLADGLGDAVHVRRDDAGLSRRTAFDVLQASGRRITRTEYISCPSCGRTLFDLEETTARIKSRTAHLKGVKIAVMGCIVNGPGEMADADFGYVGWGEGRIALFVGRDMVARDVPAAEADDRLVELLREHGRWTEPPSRGD